MGREQLTLRDTLSLFKTVRRSGRIAYHRIMPRLWSETIDEHRRGVTEAIFQATQNLVAEHGILSVTMSRIAEEAGIGRATLYKYFPNVEAILLAHHRRHINRHLEQLGALRNGSGGPAERLHAVLLAYARICHLREQHAPPEVFALLHLGDDVVEAEARLGALVQDLITEARRAGQVRADAKPRELAAYCLHALMAARTLGSDVAVRRLVAVTFAGLQPADPIRSGAHGSGSAEASRHGDARSRPGSSKGRTA